MTTEAVTVPVAKAKPVAVVRRRRRRPFATALWNIVGLLVFVVMAFPVYWMVLTAFKAPNEVISFPPHLLPTHATWSNFSAAIQHPIFWDSVRASVIVTLATVLLALLLGFFAAVGIARFRFYGRKAFIFAVLVVQMVPAIALITPLYLLLNKVGQSDQLFGVIITYLTFVLPFTVWSLRGFVANVPKDLEEAAMVDGCTRVGAFRRVVLPLVAPGIVASSIYAIIQAWNEYVMAYVLLSSPEKQTLMVWLFGFQTSRGVEFGPLMAGATMTALPVVVFFMIVQNRMAAGLTAGAVKG